MGALTCHAEQKPYPLFLSESLYVESDVITETDSLHQPAISRGAAPSTLHPLLSFFQGRG